MEEWMDGSFATPRSMRDLAERADPPTPRPWKTHICIYRHVGNGMTAQTPSKNETATRANLDPSKSHRTRKRTRSPRHDDFHRFLVHYVPTR